MNASQRVEFNSLFSGGIKILLAKKKKKGQERKQDVSLVAAYA